MHLSEYLKSNDITPLAFSQQIPCSIHAVYKWCQGRRVPRPHVQLRIKQLTHDEVDANSWLPDSPQSCR